MNDSDYQDASFDTESKIMEMYSSAAKSFNQLSSIAIGVTIVFSEKVLGDKAPIDATQYLILTWILFLTSIACGVFYQYFAVKFLENRHADGFVFMPLYPKILVKYPGVVYGVMMLAFLFGGESCSSTRPIKV